MGSLTVRSIFVLGTLYAILFAVGALCLLHYHLPVWIALAFSLGVGVLQYALGPLLITRILPIDWISPDELPEPNRRFVTEFCAANHLPLPRLGILYDPTPNAFSYGYSVSSGRVVLTQGLLDLLAPEESNAVLGHELGHIAHRDFIVMMMAAVVPLCLYQIYWWTNRDSRSRPFAWGAYFGYLICEFVVAFLSRTREFYADQFSATAGRQPNALASALVKISYGIAPTPAAATAAATTGVYVKLTAREKATMANAFGLMGVVHPRSAADTQRVSAADAQDLMQWDLVNPWARVFQLSSTHPLTAQRVQALDRIATGLNQPETYPLPAGARLDFSAFPTQFLLWAGPWLPLGLFTAYLATVAFIPRLQAFGGQSPALLLFLSGCAVIARTVAAYPGNFENAPLGSLYRDPGVSPVSPRPAILSGALQDRPRRTAAVWLADAGSQIQLVCRTGLPFANLWFRTVGLRRFAGQPLTVEGWFRRTGTPFFEVSRVSSPGARDYHSPARPIKIGWGLVLCTLAVLMLTSHLTLSLAESGTAAQRANALNNAGYTALQAGNFKTAGDDLHKAVRLAPHDDFAWNDLGLLDLNTGHPQNAVADYQAAIAANPRQPFAYNNLGLALERLNQDGPAEQAFRQQIKIVPNDRFSYANLGALLLREKNYAGALSILKTGANVADNPQVEFTLGEAAFAAGDPTGGASAFDKAVQMSPTPLLLNNVAYQLSLHNATLDQAEMDKASRYAQSAATSLETVLSAVELKSLQPAQLPAQLAQLQLLAATWDTLGWLDFERGNVAQADSYLAAAWNLTEAPDIRDHLGRIYAQEGKAPVEESVDRSVTLARPAGVPGAAEAHFLISFEPGPKVAEVRFLSGTSSLHQAIPALEAEKYNILFPAGVSTRLLRAGIMSCDGAIAGEVPQLCSFVLVPAGSALAILK